VIEVRFTVDSRVIKKQSLGAVPRVGETVVLYNQEGCSNYKVMQVLWYPGGAQGDPDPFIEVCIRSTRSKVRSEGT
jgi:hypothetical protein